MMLFLLGVSAEDAMPRDWKTRLAVWRGLVRV